MIVDTLAEGSDDEINDAAHSNLVSAVTQLEGKQRVKVSVRKEPSIEVSEFHLVKSGTGKKDAVNLHELAQSLGKRASHNEIGEKLRSSKRQSKTLPKPLEKTEANRIDRSVRYENVKKQLRKWDAIVQTNRLSDNLTFPLNQPNLNLEKSKEFLKKFSPQTPLEIEINKVLKQGVVEEEEEEVESEFPLSLEEMIQRRKELARLRVLQSYQQAKACRQKKIKSKKYHRILKREKVKQSLKDFEALKNSDPEAALKQLEELDKVRAEERASLRHRTTGQWAKSKAVRAKYDVESRKVLAQQLSISRELTQKVRKDDETSDEEDNDVAAIASNPSDNPWVGPVKTDAEITDFVSRYRKYWTEQEKTRAEAGEGEVREGEERHELETNGAHDEKTRSTEVLALFGQNGNRLSSEDDDDIQVLPGNSRSKCPDVRTAGKANKSSDSPSKKSSVAVSSRMADVIADGKRKTTSLKPVDKPLKKRKQDDVGGEIKAKVTATSGSWVVTPEKTEGTANNNSNPKTKKKKKKKKKKQGQVNVDMDELFDDIDKKFKNKVNKKIKNLKSQLKIKDRNFVVNETEPEDDLGASLAFKKPVVCPVLDDELTEGVDLLPPATHDLEPVTLTGGKVARNQKQQGRDIDPDKFMTLKPKHLKTQLPDVITAGDEALDDEQERHMTITEAFAEDDVVAEFRKAKDDTVNESKAEEVSLAMPGWGQWGGKDIAVSKRKRKRFLVKRPTGQQRKDSTMGDVIINEDKDKKLRDHMVNALPFPFTSVKSFEASIRAPIGNTWIPQSSHVKLTEPRLRTKLGAIIRPMDEDSLLKKKSKPMRMK